ncbi:HflK protein OS=Desulfurispirillum indicum (strain ATCC BAA-1389 / S5) GN=Selin_1779 PE=4 SV=1: Band_7 [Gemmata massiliana]|uniref:Band 7 domain-containing protein n=1 Tax=Gemmata massiliana TaxID=1210884 RepID=A0A6P2CWA9_9BACT|nr:protease modulator HflK [Gemmata massiliana]VTR92676.1 HflK protein OS=Desulfurispirillum indicum (strain ATCC BAA-1389 / S5) GN=Selin_1779 PE=4 SV=1: Band_7 [Gemmata massiliana]
MKVRYLVLAVATAYLLTGVYQVAPDERAVVRRFGGIVARPGPGLGFGLPWGIDRVDRVPVRTVRQLRVGYDSEAANDTTMPAGQLLTGDQNLVNVQIVLDYAIGEADQDLDDYVIHRDLVDPTLSRTAEAVAGEWVAGHTVDQVLLTGTGMLPAWVMDRLAERLPELKLGIRVQRVSVALIAPPDEVRAAFEAVTQAQTAIRTKEFQAQQERDQRSRQADAIRYRLGQEASEYRESQLRLAQADATEFLAQLAAYRDVRATNPDALSFLWWDEMRRTMIAMKTRGGKVRPLDHHLQNGELNVTEFVPLPKR